MHSVQKNPVLFNSSDLPVKHSTSGAVMNVELLHILMLICLISTVKATWNLSLVIDIIYCFSIIEFLCKFPNPINLLKSVDELIDNPFNLASVRGLGIVNKVATGPLWRICENKSILEMTPYLVDLKLKLDNFRQDSRPILEHKKLILDPRRYSDLVAIDQDCNV